MESMERTAVYYIVASVVIGLLGVLLLSFWQSPNLFFFGFVSLGGLGLAYCCWNFWR